MGIPHATDAFVEAEKPHAVVRSFVPTYEQHYFLAVLIEFVKEFMKKAKVSGVRCQGSGGTKD